MPGINNIGSRTIMGAGAVSRSMYQKNQKNETDPKGKLVIQNFDRDITTAVFYGWDLISADELDDNYIFQLMNRENSKLRVYITLSRELQYAELPYYPEMMYQCYIHDDNGEWDNRSWFRAHDITYKNFWGLIEETVTNHHLPF